MTSGRSIRIVNRLLEFNGNQYFHLLQDLIKLIEGRFTHSDLLNLLHEQINLRCHAYFGVELVHILGCVDRVELNHSGRRIIRR